ncbi:hypothetical protein BC628DRAFT_1415893 [Trametes gibbosa]|nr:hypothetical protein BC628DRAFT_1415893 [Trametes gibbosa]
MNATTDGSDSQWELVEEYIQYLAQDRDINYIDLVAFVVLLFEHLITLDCEVQLAWGRKLSCARVVFLLNRYLSLFLLFLSLVPLLPTNNLVGQFMIRVLTAILYTVWAVFSGLRIYAISNHSRFVTLAVVSLALVPVGTNIVRTLSVITRGCLTASEGIVIIITWMNTWHKDRSSCRMGAQTSFMALVLREGMVYFSVLLALNITQIIFTFAERNAFSLLLQFTNVLTPILISRFYFDLDDLQTQEWMTTLPSARHTTLRFAANTSSSFDEGSYDSDTSTATFNDTPPPTPPAKDRFPQLQIDPARRAHVDCVVCVVCVR